MFTPHGDMNSFSPPQAIETKNSNKLREKVDRRSRPADDNGRTPTVRRHCQSYYYEPGKPND